LGSYFEIECLRNDFFGAVVVEEDMENLNKNQFILSTLQFKLVVGKSVREPQYFDIPCDGKVITYLRRCKLGEQINPHINRPYNVGWWYNSIKRIFKKTGRELEQGFCNYLRIAKAKWIDELDISIWEKKKMHERMNHSFLTTIQYYL